MSSDESFAALIRQMTNGVERIARDQVRLATMTAKERAGRATRGGLLMGAAGILAVLGTGCLAVAALLGLGAVLDRPWFAGVIVAAVLLVTALLVIAPGWRGLVVERVRAVPISTAQSVRQDVEAVRRALRR
jgi:hypothetical protein